MRLPFPAGMVLAILASAAVAQTAPPSPAAAQAPAASVFQESCPSCGIVRSVKRVETEQPATMSERQSTIGSAGLAASVPLGGGSPSVGSATDVRRDLKPATVVYEIVVRLDDGRFQLVRQDSAHDLREGDKVRIEGGKVTLRTP